MNKTGQSDADNTKGNTTKPKVLDHKMADAEPQRKRAWTRMRSRPKLYAVAVGIAVPVAACLLLVLKGLRISFGVAIMVSWLASLGVGISTVYFLFFERVSMYFTLFEGSSHVYHLQKRPLASLLLFAKKRPREALFALSMDLKEYALPAALARISSGEHLIIVTHLVSPGIITRHLHASAWEPLGRQLGKALPAQACACAAALVRFLRTGRWAKPGLAFRRWYLIHWVKP